MGVVAVIIGSVAAGIGIMGIHGFLEGLVETGDGFEESTVLEDFAIEFGTVCDREYEVDRYWHSEDMVIEFEGYDHISVEDTEHQTRLDCPAILEELEENRIEPEIVYEFQAQTNESVKVVEIGEE